MDNNDWITKIRPKLYALKWQSDGLARGDAEKIIDKKWLQDHDGYNLSVISIPKLLTEVAEGRVDPPICPLKVPDAPDLPPEVGLTEATAPVPNGSSKTSFKLKKRLARSGPAPDKRNAAAEKLRSQFRTGGLKEIDLGPRQDGGLTTEEVSGIIGCGRTSLPEVMEIVLGEREFMRFRKPWRERNEGQKKPPGKWD